MHCPICKSMSVSEKYILYDDRYAYPESYNLFECLSCGHKFLDASFSQDMLENLYSNYYPRSSLNVENFSPHQEAKGIGSWFNGKRASTFRWVPENVKVLDIGCGFGESLGYHKARGCDVWGVEADNNILRVAQKYGYNVKVGLFNSKNYEKETFDYVTMDQVIEHVVDPIGTVKGIATLLKPGGMVVMSTPNSNGWGAKVFGRRWINWHTPYHIHHFSVKSIKMVAEQAGLEIQMIKTITHSRWLNYQWIHYLFFPEQGEKSIFWAYESSRPSWMAKAVIKMFSILHRTGIDHVLTRLFDGMGVGDNFLIILRKKKSAE